MFKKIIFKAYHKYIKQDKLFEFFDFYNQTQFWSKDGIQKYQWNKFKKIVEYAYNNVPYYKEIFDKKGIKPNDIQTKADLNKIDILTKEKVRANFHKLKSENLNQFRYKVNSTSGSTGENLKFLSDISPSRPALQKRCYDWMGINFLDKKMTIWGAGWDVKKAKKIESRIKGWIKGTIVLSGYNLSDADLDYYYKIMKDFNPELLISYPSILYDIAKYFEKNNYAFSPKAIQIGGEKLFPFQREYIEKVFKTKIFDFYGARDMRLIAQECDKHEGLHIMAENVLVEVLDENNNPVEEGEGDLVITDLHNKVMPFIRYRIGDRAIVTQKQCSCGRGLPLLKEVIGRSFEIIEFPNGNKVGGTFWTILLKTQPGIKNLQVIQKALDHIQINYVPENKNAMINFDNFIEKIHEFSGPDLKVKFNEVPEIPLTKGGKFRFVIKETDKE